MADPTTRLQVQWPNPGHELLAEPAVTVTVDGADISPLSTGPGKQVFDIPPGSMAVSLSVNFTYTATDGTLCLVLQADQAYKLDGTALVTDDTPAVFKDGNIVFQNQHPLVDTRTAANAANGLTIAEIRTEFVVVTDILTPIYRADLLREFKTDRNVLGQVVAIGATGSTPPLWYAHFPIGMSAAPDPAIPAFVFFRPLNYAYAKVDSTAHQSALSALNRYLLTPVDEDTPYVLAGADDNDTATRPPGSLNYFYDTATGPWIRAGFENAVIDTGKQLVMLHPWPSQLDFGDAATRNLQTSVQGILRMLRGMGYVALNQPKVTLGRLGLGGYSAGGDGLYAALANNRNVVKEVYIFDCMRTADHAAMVIQWASNTDDFRLQMTGSEVWSSVKAIYTAVAAAAGTDNVSYHPLDQTFWKRESDGGSPWWSYVLTAVPDWRNQWWSRHQMVLFGGETFVPGPGLTVASAVPWMQQFLAASGF